MLKLGIFIVLVLVCFNTHAKILDQYSQGRDAILSQQGCYIIDYSYVETEALQAGYVKDPRVYDVNKARTFKEYIYAIEYSPNRIRLQHVLFFQDKDGSVNKEAMLRHQAEDWEYQAPYLYDFEKPQTWNVLKMDSTEEQWTRRITNLDDGLRYQCAAAWTFESYPTWTCANYAPIPGREIRDMGRKDYNTLDRITKIVTYQNSWLERQENIKTIYKEGVKTPLVKELGKNWYVRLPDSDCADVKAYAERGHAFWELLRETWDEVLNGQGSFVEVPDIGSKRYMEVLGIEAAYTHKDLSNKDVKAAAKKEIIAAIEKYRILK